MRYKLSVLFAICSAVLFGQSLSGNWYGTLDVMGQKLPLVLHLTDSMGTWQGTLDSPKQNAFGKVNYFQGAEPTNVPVKSLNGL